MSSLSVDVTRTRRSPQSFSINPEFDEHLEFDTQFERRLPPEILTELEESPPRIYLRPPPPTYRVAAQVPQEVFFRPAPPVSPPPQPPPRQTIPPLPPIIPTGAKPAQSAPRSGSGGWWLLAVIVGFLILVGHLPKRLQPATIMSPQPWVEVRRALPVAPRALPVTAQVSSVPTGWWQSIRMPDGSFIGVRYQGELASSAALPPQGHFIGEEYSVGTTSWIWMTRPGASLPSWVDP
jgi:hypothetical protein